MPQKKTQRIVKPPMTEEEVYRSRLSGRLPENRHPHIIDLFAGAGGMSLGFSSFLGHSFKSVWANDFNEYAAKTYNANFEGHCKVGDIVDILDDPTTTIPHADVVIGGPPCQGFSLLNKNRDADPRKELWRPYMEVVDKSGAEIFVMENVPQLLGTVEYRKIVEKAAALGFQVTDAILCAAEYGVPQVRWRAFIVGCKFTDPADFFPPKRTNKPDGNGFRRAFVGKDVAYIANSKNLRTVRDVIKDLPPPVGTEVRDVGGPLDLHFGRNPTAVSLKRYQAIPEEGMNRFDLQERAPEITPACWIRKTSGGTDLFGRLWWDKPSVTIRTEFFKPEKGRYLHPSQHRPITHREAARIQTFPDSFKFTGSKIEIAKQIGNAVPSMLAARVADCVFAMLHSRNNVG